MSSFPILDLPLLARVELIQNMHLEHILRLSDCSRRMNRLVKEANIRLHVMRIRFSDDRANPTLMNVAFNRFNGCGRLETVRMSVTTESNVVRRATDQEWIGADGMRMLGSSEREGSCTKVYPEGGDFSEACGRVIGNLLGLFRVGQLKVILYPRQLENSIWRHIKSLYGVTVKDQFAGRRLTAANIKFLFDDLGGGGERYIYPKVEDGFEYRDGFKLEHIMVQHATWVHLDAVVNSRCKKIYLSGIQMPPAAQLNAILKQWVAKEKMENLERLVLEGHRDTPLAAGFMDEVLKDIVTEPYASGQHVDNGNPLGIRRADRKFARILVIGPTFNFTVTTYSF